MKDLVKLYEIAEASCTTDEELGELNTLYTKLETKLKMLSYVYEYLDLDEMERRLKIELALFGTKNIPESTQKLLTTLKYYGRGEFSL